MFKKGDVVLKLKEKKGKSFYIQGDFRVLDMYVMNPNAINDSSSLVKIIEAQTVEGYWRATAEFLEILVNGMNLVKAERVGSKPEGEEAQCVWMTKIVVDLLISEFADDHKKLKFILKKAKRWLKEAQERNNQ